MQNKLHRKSSEKQKGVQASPSVVVCPTAARGEDRILLHQYFVPNDKAKSKSRASFHVMEFLSRVFASDGASRFFKTFLLRFLFDGGGQSSDDCSTLRLAV